MNKIGIFYGSDTGNTKKISKIIQKKIGVNIADIYDISKSNKKDIKKYDKLLFGISTWYYGEAQSDWEDFFINLKKINFKNKIVALYGCGDQEDYSEYFCDALSLIKNIIKPKGAKIIGKWPIKNYNFNSSKSLIDSNNFIGLTIDEDRQPELTNTRINKWIEIIKKKMNIK